MGKLPVIEVRPVNDAGKGTGGPPRGAKNAPPPRAPGKRAVNATEDAEAASPTYCWIAGFRKAAGPSDCRNDACCGVSKAVPSGVGTGTRLKLFWPIVLKPVSCRRVVS